MNTEEKVKNILSELSGNPVIDSRMTLQDELALDSLSMVALLIEIEEAFGIELDEADMNPYDLNTVQDVINMVDKYRGEKNE